jgi:serine/threonine protein kinase
MAASLAPGTLLADTYRVIRLIGVGGMGEVYEVAHDRLAGRYAVKVLLAEIMNRADVFQRFRREAEVTSGLRHPNIVQVLDFNVTAEGHPYLVMEYLDGVELAAEIARVGAMPPDRVLDLVGQIASALAAAQNHKIVHRDLKPQNLFLVRLPGEDREVLKVVDFGISKVREATTKLTQDTAIIGTPQYMAPEQAQGKGALIDERTDEFALAAITYELLTGRPAFAGESVPSTLYQVVHEQPDPPSTLVPGLSPAIDAVIGKALAKAPADRYPSALAFHRELLRAFATSTRLQTVALPNPSPPRSATALYKPEPHTTLGLAAASPESSKLRPRSPARRLFMLALAGIVLVAGAGVGLETWRRTRPVVPLPPLPAPVAVQPAPAPKRETIKVVYSTEKAAWLHAATADFVEQHPDILVDLVGKGSMEAARGILEQQLQATVWSPADSVLLDLLGSDWRTQHQTQLFPDDEDSKLPLVLTPLVFMIWEDRANVLTKAGSGAVTWKTLRQGLTSPKGWLVIGGDRRWGTVTLGHTDPTQSNSGLQALYSMWIEHTGKLRLSVQDVLDAKHQDFMRGIEKGVVRFEARTGTLATDMVRFGSSKYDLVAIYEASAISELANAEGRWGKLRVCYPATTVWSDNPAVVLAAPWVTEAQARAGRAYVEYLRSGPAQLRALEHGFRPADTSVKLRTTDAKNPFAQYADHGLSVDLPPAADMPDGVVVRALMTTWSRLMRPSPP